MLAVHRASPPLILVVEDDRDNREMYVEYLRCAGLRTAEATDTETAFELAIKLGAAVVVADEQLRGPGTGTELCARLHADPRTKTSRRSC